MVIPVIKDEFDFYYGDCSRLNLLGKIMVAPVFVIICTIFVIFSAFMWIITKKEQD